MGAATREISAMDQHDTTNATPSTAALRTEIEATRAELTDTVNAIQAKLSPSSLKDAAGQITEEAVDKFKTAALDVTDHIKQDIRSATIGKVENMANNLRAGSQNAGNTIVDTIKENPIPAALIGFGLAWLFFGKLNSGSSNASDWRRDPRYYDRDVRYGSDYGQDSYRYQGRYEGRPEYRYGEDTQGSQQGVRERVSDVAGDVASGISDAASNVKYKAGDVASGISDAASNVKYKAGEFVDSAQERVGVVGGQIKGSAGQVVNKSQTLMQENPLMAGAVALALGAAVGMMLPVTEQENQLMGQARDKFMDRAGGVMHETVDKAQRVVSQAADAAKESVKRELHSDSSANAQQTP